MTRDLELEVELDNETELLHPHDKTLEDEELLFMDDQRKGFLELESTPSDDAVNVRGGHR